MGPAFAKPSLVEGWRRKKAATACFCKTFGGAIGKFQKLPESNRCQADRKIACSTASKITGPWKSQGLLAEVADNTIHQGIITFKNKDYFFYHNGAVQHPNTGGSHRRSVCIDELLYSDDGRMKRVVQTSEGISPAK